MLWLIRLRSYIYRRGGIPYLISKVAPSSLPHKDAAIVFAGDSITNFYAWHKLLERPVLNRGISGDTVEGLRRRIGEVLRHHPRQLFIMIGINDLLGGKTGDEVLAQYQPLIDQVRIASPHTQIFLQSILPVNGATWSAASGSKLQPDIAKHILQVNKALADMADGKQIIYVDLYLKMVAEANQLDKRYTSDGIHLNVDGYIKWRDVVRPYLAPDA